MKFQPRQFDSYCAKPDANIRAFIIFGPDNGLVRERMVKVAKTVVDDLQDPFLVSEFDADILQEDPARLNDEAAAISMMGGRRVVLIRGAGDKQQAIFNDFLDNPPPGDSLIIVTAGELKGKSKLKTAFETSPMAAAVACYEDGAADLSQMLHARMKQDNITVERDAADFIITNLGGDRGLSRTEIDKLALYAGPNGTLNLEDAAISLGDSSALRIDAILFSALEGNSVKMDKALGQAFEEKYEPIALIRSLSNHLLRLSLVKVKISQGSPLDGAMKQLRPPVFFKAADPFKRQIRIWGQNQLAQASSLCLEAERKCKLTGFPPQLICGNLFQNIAALARRQMR